MIGLRLSQKALSESLFVLLLDLAFVVIVVIETKFANVQEKIQWNVKRVNELFSINEQEGNEAANGDDSIDKEDPPVRGIEFALHFFVVIFLTDNL